MAFSPTDIAGLQLWLKADAGLYQDAAKTTPAVNGGDVVGAWEDQSGNGNDATQATTSKKPLLKLNIVNGKPVVRFDGTDDEHAKSGFSPNLSAGDYSLFATHMRNTRGDGWEAIISFAYADTSGGAPLITWIKDLSSSPAPFIGANNVGISPDNVHVDLVSELGNYYITSILRTGGTNGNDGTITVRAYGASQSFVNSGTQTWDSNPVSGIWVGRHFWTASKWLDGDIAEILVYNSALSDASRQNVENYLNEKYNVY